MSNKSKGFITIATGDDHYYEIAVNLLKSYHYFTKKEDWLPFAILCDKENDYTKEFDDVIILENPYRSYLDKISLLINIPYNQTIFIESDVLAYSDMNQYFELFHDADEFSVFGAANPIDFKNGWFKISETGKYQDSISFIPGFHSCVLQFRIGNKCAKMHEICMDVKENYSEYNIGNNMDCLDDKLLAISSAVVGCKPTKNPGHAFVVYPFMIRCHQFVYPQMKKKKLQYKIHRKDDLQQGMCCHFSAYLTNHYLYKREVNAMEIMDSNTVQSSEFKDSLLKYFSYKLWERKEFIHKPRIAKIVKFASNITILRKIWHLIKGNNH